MVIFEGIALLVHEEDARNTSLCKWIVVAVVGKRSFV
jgi:hypothetical protein